MPAPLSDRNLLFGILALNMEFITKDALIQAMHAWLGDKSKSIGTLLVDQKHLAVSRCQLLEALVEEHLKKHDNNAEKSLASISSVGSVREELKQIADPDVQASLIHVSAARVHDPEATAMSSVGQSTSSGQRFRILRPHAKGGLGQVSVAIDQELNRQVALKEIQDKQGLADDPNYRARFRLEAEINGGLEHPNIVPVYGLGTYADGRPYYAMRFIKGDSLKDAIERFHQDDNGRMDVGERSLKLRELLGRFVDVCNAIAYAHSRGVLHRDLKPGNIMLGPYGETLVVDWGLAKTIDRPDLATSEDGRLVPSSSGDSAPTQMGKALGTYQYMSPEQAMGQLDKLGAATDVYSLGATLYSLLTGQPAFKGVEESDRVQKGLFPRPSLVKKDVPAGLEAICLKAMSREPEQRYPSAKALAGDIEHWLADEPVTAYREPVSVRMGRWMKRNRTLVSSLVVLLTTAVTGLTVGIVLLGQEQVRTEEQRLEAEGERQKANTKAREATEAKEKAEKSADEARRRADAEVKVRRSFRSLLGVFRESDPLGFLQGYGSSGQSSAESNPMVRTFIERTAPTLLKDPPEDPVARAELLDTLGDFLRGFGHLKEAEPLLQEALDLRRQHLGLNNADYAASLHNMAWLYQDQGHYTHAEQLYQEALAIRLKVLGPGPIVDTTRFNLAVLLTLLGDFEKAEDLLMKVLTARRARDGDNTREVAVVKGTLAALYLDQGQAWKALPWSAQAIATFQKLDENREIGKAIALFQEGMFAGFVTKSYTVAEERFKTSLGLISRTLGEQHPYNAFVLGEMAKIQE